MPLTAWREKDFDDSAWSNASAPIYYSTSPTEPPFYEGGIFNGTKIEGMMDSYSSFFLRKEFTVSNPSMISELQLDVACDDGFIAWINGIEVARYNVVEGERPFDDFASNSVNEPASLDTFLIPNPTMLLPGANLLAVQVFNSASNSSDLGFMAGLSAPVDVTPPFVVTQFPPAGATVGELSQIEITFNEVVFGIEASDLVVNGTATVNVTGSGSGPFFFTFPSLPEGNVAVGWIAAHGIHDGSGNNFGGGTWKYTISSNFIVPLARITELMAANNKTLADEDGDYPDWIEILNPRQTSLNLSNWCLTDNSRNLAKWRFPAVTLSPGERLVVFASGKNRTNSTRLHTNFSLSNGRQILAW